jgi:hypothetical protein
MSALGVSKVLVPLLDHRRADSFYDTLLLIMDFSQTLRKKGGQAAARVHFYDDE